ncbi:MAG TPA: VIT domain-containing protein [Thermoanaerobaculia bacterium]|jgi:hypothetical protein
MRRLAALLLFCTLTLAADEKPRVPTLTVAGDDGNVALELSALTVRVTVRGHLARTELELTWRNSLDRVTGGEFSFPLPADAEVSDVGLWFGEHLRHGVAVERVLARRAYEETIHRSVDPALVEWRAGRAFSYEVYPIPAKGEKKVFLAYDQELTGSDYALDLSWAPTQLQLTVDAEGRETRTDGVIRVARDANESALLARGDDGAWYASAAIDVAHPDEEALPASHVLILVDTSASSVRQNAAKIRAFLTAFLARQNAWATADVVPFHIAVDPPRRIEKAGTMTGALELERILRELQPLGATNLLELTAQLPKLIEPLPPSTRVVVVTDGLTSLGDSREVAAAVRKLTSLRRPLVLVNAAQSTDDLLLANAAAATGGWHVDLTRSGVEAAVDSTMRVPRVVQFDGVVPRVILASSAGRFAVAQRSTTAINAFAAKLPLRELHGATERSMVRRAYARVQLRELLARGAPDEEILAHGRAFTQVTPRTSLLVLETWRDYERYKIELPPDVLEAKLEEFAEAERRRAVHEARVNRPLAFPRGSFSEAGAWSISGVITGEDGNPLPGVTVWLDEDKRALTQTFTDESGRFTLFSPVAPQNGKVTAELSGLNSACRTVPASGPLNLTLAWGAVTETITVTAAAPLLDSPTMSVATTVSSLRVPLGTKDELLHAIDTEAVTESDDPEVRAAVAKQRRELTREVLEKMRVMRTTSERLRYYIASRALLGGDKSFHVFAAEIFRQRSPEVAARVLMDLAEARPDDAPLLRILARVLDGWDEPQLARLLLLRAIEIAPDEPQSWRELIVLDARAGRVSAVHAHAKRFRAIPESATWRATEIYEQTEEALQRWERSGEPGRGIDLRADPEDDVTVDLMYDSGWLWMDLHVTEPSGERVAWDHQQSAAGGRVTGGMIFGYGPQMYTIRNAPRGTYRVDIDYYSVDETNVTQETLAHVVVMQGGERRELFLVLSAVEERRTLTSVEVP